MKLQIIKKAKFGHIKIIVEKRMYKNKEIVYYYKRYCRNILITAFAEKRDEAIKDFFNATKFYKK